MSERLLVTGRIATLAGEAGFGWAGAILVEAGRVVVAGGRDVADLAQPGTARITLGPAHVALPSITDAHLHLADAALAAHELDLEAAATLDEGLELIAVAHRGRLAAGDDTGWLLGRGWSVDRWGQWPAAAALEAAAPGRRICLWSHDHHSVWLSPAALSAAEITSGTADPPGGAIVRDVRGEPTGILLEGASRLVDPAIPPPDAGTLERAMRDHAAWLAALGVTGCHDPGSLRADPGLERGVGLYRRLAREGRLPLRVHASIRREQLGRAVEEGLRSGDRITPEEAGDEAAGLVARRFRVGWLKLFADGALGSRTAALLAPYEAAPGGEALAGELGTLRLEPGELAALAREAALAGFATQVHAIGDGAARVALDALEPNAGAPLPLRPRLEHVQLLDPADRPRFAAHGIAASVQPVHLRSDAPAARWLWGSRADVSYPYGSLAAAGALLAFGTDAPVEPPDPWPGISLAVTRLDPAWAEAGPLAPGERLDLTRAIRAACLGPALVAGEHRGGRLVPGCPADLVVLPAEALAEPVAPGGALASARPLLTLLDGEEVHRDPAFDA